MAFRRRIINAKPVALIFRRKLLALSESFIKEQCDNGKRYSHRYVGLHVVEGSLLSKNDIFLVNDGSLAGFVREILYSLFGVDFGLIKRLAKLNPVLMHAHFGPDALSALPIAKKLKIPLVVTFHGYDVTTDISLGLSNFAKINLAALKTILFFRWYHRKLPALFGGTNLFIAVSEFIKQKLVTLGAPEEKIVRHYIGVDMGKWTADPDIKREAIVLFVGRLVEVKGPQYLIKAMEKIEKGMPDARLVVIGDGPLRLSLEKMAKDRLKNYSFRGFQPSEEVRRWMSRARVLSVPSVKSSLGTEEGFGMVFIEASAMGLPVASFSSGGIVEAVDNKITGLLAPPKDWEALATNIKKLLGDDDLWRVMSKQSRERVASKFDIRKQSKALEDIYDSIFQGKNR